MIIIMITFKQTCRIPKSTFPDKSFAEWIYGKKMRRRKLGADRLEVGEKSQENLQWG